MIRKYLIKIILGKSIFLINKKIKRELVNKNYMLRSYYLTWMWKKNIFKYLPTKEIFDIWKLIQQ